VELDRAGQAGQSLDSGYDTANQVSVSQPNHYFHQIPVENSVLLYTSQVEYCSAGIFLLFLSLSQHTVARNMTGCNTQITKI